MLVDGSCVLASEVGQQAPKHEHQQYQQSDPSIATPAEEYIGYTSLEQNATADEESAPPALAVGRDPVPFALAVELELLRDLHLEGLLSHQELEKQQMCVLRAHGRPTRFCCLRVCLDLYFSEKFIHQLPHTFTIYVSFGRASSLR